MAYEQEIKFLAEKEAKRNDRSSVPLTGDVELNRFFPTIRDDIRQSGLAFLARFTSAANVGEIAADTPKYYVDDPLVDGKVYPGRYRAAVLKEGRLETDPLQQGVIQILRKGYLETLLGSTGVLDWSEARKVDGKNLQQSEGYRTVRWVNCSPFTLNAMALSLNAASFSNISVGGEVLSGVWHNITVSTAINPEDGSGIITVFLAQPEFTLTAYQHALTGRAKDITYLYQVPKDLAQGVLDLYKTEGASASASYPNAAGLVDIMVVGKTATAVQKLGVTTRWNCDHKETTDYYWDLTTAAADAIVLAAPPQGWTYAADKSLNSDSLWDVKVVKTQSLPRSYDAVTVEVSGESTGTMREQINVVTPDAVASEAGVIVAQRRQHTDECLVNAVTSKDTGIAQTSTVKIVSPAGTTDITTRTVQTTVIEAPVTAKGHIKRVENRASKYPLRYDTVNQDEVPTDQTAVSVDNSVSRVSTKTLHTESATDLVAPAIVKGTITRQDATPTEAGNQRTIVEVTVPTDQTAVSVDNSESRVTTKTLHTENATDLVAPAIVKGTITRQEATPTEAGNQRTVVEVTIPTDQTAVAQDVSSAVVSVKTTHTENPVTALPHPAKAKGFIYREEAIPTEAGNLRTTEETLSAYEQTEISGEDSLDHSVLRTVVKENSTYAATVAPTAAAGTVKRVTASPTEFGNADTVEEIITVKNRDVTEGAAEAFKTTLVTLATQKLVAEAVPTAAAGMVKIVKNTPTDTGFRTEKTDITAVLKTETSRTSVVADDYTEVTDRVHNAASIPDADVVANADVRIEGQMNEFEKYDYTKVVRTSTVPRSCPVAVTWDTLGGWYGIGVWRERYHNTLSFHLSAAEAVAALAGGWQGSSPSNMGGGLWAAHKVVRDDIFTG